MYTQGQVLRRTWGGICNVSKVYTGPLRRGLAFAWENFCMCWLGWRSRSLRNAMTVVCTVPAISSLFCCGRGPYSHLENSCPGQMEGADLLKRVGQGVLLASWVESAGAVLFPPGVHVSRLGQGVGEGRKWHLPALWFLEKFPIWHKL